MKRFVLICLLPVAALLAVAGCSGNPRKNPRIATEVEENFKQRWIAQRMSELQANKQAADAREARRIANEEFKRRYSYTSVAQQPDATTGVTPQ